MDRRSRARELAMQALFQLDAQGQEMLKILEVFLRDASDDELVQAQAKKWTLGTWRNIEKCDNLIKDAAKRWQIARLSAVERSILRVCAYQLAFCPEIPPKVVINEGIELAKKFSTEQSPSFVNGVLDAIMKNIKAEQETSGNE